MWADGRNETVAPDSDRKPSISSMPRHWASSLAWVSCTPLGGPVVPEV